MRSTLDHSSIINLDLFGDLITIGICCHYPIEKQVDSVESGFYYYSQLNSLFVGSDKNKQ